MDAYTLKSVSDLPSHFRSIFTFRYFNPLQSECFPVCFHSDVNMVISAPTGSGKTVLFELCILRLLSRFISGQNFIHVKGTLKTVYIAPSKALVQEKVRDWNNKFGPLGIACLELTGDNEFYDSRTIQEADIILTTPEKFDAVTRYRIKNGGLSFFSDIALLLIDEVHLLNDPRGAALEAIVSRIKMLSSNPELRSSPLSTIRLLAVSATVPNIGDLAEWLNVPVKGIKRLSLVQIVRKSYFLIVRLSRLQDIPQQRMIFSLKRQVVRLQNYIFDTLMQFSKGKSALIFCSTRKGAQETAQQLSQTVMNFGYSNPFIKDHEQKERLREASMSFSDKQMQSYILYGIGYHNGGLCMKDRSLVEGLFLKGDIQVLCTTNTLAHGVNLPAHTVVIKSTQHYNKEKGLYMEYDRSTVLQMCGRAGRPPFDDTGTVIIMTKRETVHLYENLLNGCELVESQLLPCVTEHLTAEIVQLTVSDIARAIEWMKCSYLYVRMKKASTSSSTSSNPENYAVSRGINRESIEKHIKDVCVHKVQELSRYQMISTDHDGFILKPLEPGRLMTKYYLKFDTMKHIMLTPDNCSLEDALKVVCRAEEISWIQLRRNEKKVLNDINADKGARLRFHVNDERGKRKKRIQSKEEKIFILANDCLTGDPAIRDLSLSQDMNSVCTNGCRIAKCMKEYFLFKRNYKGAVQTILLAKSLYQKLWDDSPYLLKQLPGIGMVTAKALHSMGVKSFDALAEADPRRIEIITCRKFPFGNHIKDSLLSLPPKVDMSIEEIDSQRQGKSKIKVTLTRLSQSSALSKRHFADMIVGVEEENQIHFHEKIRVDEFSSPYSATILVSANQQQKLTIKADFMFEEYLGLDCHQKLILMKEGRPTGKNHNRPPPNKQPPCVPLSKEVCAIEVDDESMSSNAAAAEDNSMPSFKLLDEDIEDEDEPVVEIQNDKFNNNWSERTIFDHIREKAKSFPIINTSEAFLLQSEEQQRGLNETELELGRRLDAKEDSIIDLTIDPSWLEQEGEDIILNSHSSTIEGGRSFVEDREGASGGGIAPEPEKALNGEAIFDHIRRKAEEFPFLTSTLRWMNEPSLEPVSEPPEVGPRPECFRKGDVVLSDSHPGGQKVKVDAFSPSPGRKFTGLSLPSKSLPVSKVDRPPRGEMLSFDISMMKGSNSNSGSKRKEQQKEWSPSSGSKRQRCGLAMPVQTGQADSFMGFQSVFSFL
ncbi:unnamed protein product [Linum tenue]|uniref:DNA 3'-5' helicase n=1 Tax=Linum tenue TaxID=586396 RepID=A0AAV0NCP0_9ROSI|nr:unnamed protein product [Linum tenue]